MVGSQEPTLDPLAKSTLKAIDQNPSIILTGNFRVKGDVVDVYPSYAWYYF